MTSSNLVIVDLSEFPRLGFKGRGTLPAMRTRGLVFEPRPNHGFRQADGSICVVLAESEVLLLGPLDGRDYLGSLENEWRIENLERTYPVPRRHSHSWFAIQGTSAPEMMAKLCAVDLRPHRFTDLCAAQTSVARLNSIVLRADTANQLTYHLLADSASAVYLLACLIDSAAEFGGRLAETGYLV